MTSSLPTGRVSVVRSWIKLAALAAAILVAMNASQAVAQTTVVWTGAAANNSWTSGANWSPSRGANAWATTEIAQFGSAGSQTLISWPAQNFTANTLTIGAVEAASSRAQLIAIGNNNTTGVAGTLALTGVTMGGDANVILKNSSNQLFRIQPSINGGTSPLSLTLSNATTNQVIIDGSGDILISAVVQGVGRSLTKSGTGSGELKLTGANTYSGGTVINSGTVYASNANLADSATGTGTVTVNSGGTLGGVGRAAGAVTVNSDGTLAPGESVGTLTLGDGVDLLGTLSIEYDDTLSQKVDLAVVTGNLSLGAASVLEFIDISSPAAPLTGAAHVIATYGSLTGAFATVVNLPAGYTLDYAYNDGFSSNNIALVAAAVPEASALLFGGLACAAAGAGRLVVRRRRPLDA
jgi:autotransporter-associated beta strand protein